MRFDDYHASRVRLSGLFLTVVLIATAPASFAQEEDATQAASGDIEEITVTGSRIPRPGVDTFYPAVSVGTEELENNAFTNVADALNEIPAFGNPDATPLGVQNSFSIGQNFVDFLGLGSQRTLTLVNGKRFVSSNSPIVFGESGGLQVDFNVIPLALVDRIEVIGVGGAPIYGSDAIAGTINVVLKDRFEGVEVGYRFGPSEQGDADFYHATFVAGTNFAEDRGNITFSAETYEQDSLLRKTRPFFSDNEPFFAEDTVNPTDPNVAISRIFRDQRINILTFGGLASTTDPCPFAVFERCIIPSFGVGAFPDGNFYEFDPSGNLVQYTPGAVAPGSFFFALGGDGEDFFDLVEQLQSPLKRDIFTARMNYDILENVRFYSNVLYANTQSKELVRQGGFQTFAFGGTSRELVFPTDHPFLTQQAQDVFAANGMTEFTLHRFNNDIIDPSSFREQHLWRYVAGLQGDFELAGRNWNWEAYAIRGESDGTTLGEGIIDARFLNAIDVRQLTAADLAAVPGGEFALLGLSGTATAGVGDIICESVFQAAIGNITGVSGNGVTDSDLPFIQGCVPLNLFGEGVRSDAARQWVTGRELTKTDIDQTIYNVNFGGELFELPAGALGFNVGYETRKEEAVFQPGVGSAIPLTRSSAFQRTGGEYETDEIFGEVLIPVVSPDMGIPFLDMAEINGAVREIDNSLAGGATVWTAGGRFAPVADITFRGNYTESIRAPSLVELFAPITGSFSFADDPCDNRFVGEGPAPATREANCRAELGVDPSTFTSNIVNATAQGRTGGNPNLDNETAESFSFGITLEPRWVDNLVLTADYIEIALTQAIVSLDLTTLMEACYDSPSFPNVAACDSFTRNASGQVTDFLTGQTNAQNFDVEFVNYSASYGFDVAEPLGWAFGSLADNDLGFLTTRARVSHTRERLVSVTGDPAQSEVGSFEDPEYSGTFDFIWDYGDNTRIFYRLIWQAAAKLDPTGDNIFQHPIPVLPSGELDVNNVTDNLITESDARYISNLSLSYNFGHLFNGGENDMVVQFSIDNLFDRKPDLIQQAAGDFTLLEMIGRRYTLSFRAAF
ncbi:MAG TPA: TonB-dependent receptor [Woeseiaceae bacterium]|nr:TonB-dependent receptor [Woeseiaceae bacterium]